MSRVIPAFLLTLGEPSNPYPMEKNVTRRMGQVFGTLLLQAVILFGAASTLKWMWAWIFLLAGVVILAFNAMVLPRELIEERGKKKRNVKKWDKTLTSISLIPMLGMYLLSGLDFRFLWTGRLPAGVHIVGLAGVLLGAMLFTWSMVSNHFFSTMVRIQDDRNHQVATQGPYKYVRHPGYVGYILMSVATPVALGSLYGLSMAFLVSAIFVVRTSLEDKTLLAELPGYASYSGKVRYKLVPYLW